MTTRDVNPLLRDLHAASDEQTYARARAQFAGSDDEFLRLAQRYRELGPEKRGEFLEEHGLSTNDADGAADAGLSLAISPATGELLSSVVLAKRAVSVLELGSSNGVSTLYIARALRMLGQGTVIATERHPDKCARLRENVEAAGLQHYVDLRQGNIFDVVADLTGPFDVVFIDVWSSAYLEAIKLVDRLIAPGTVILADNMYTARNEVRPFKEYLEFNPRFATTTLPFEAGVELAVVLDR
jgi:predicted O-methyltransferase YrrM